MLLLILYVILIWLVLIAFLAFWTVWFQGYIYTEPVGQIYWRAPAAGTALAAFIAVWVIVDYRMVKSDPDYRCSPLYELTAPEKDAEPFKELRVPRERGGEDVYELVPLPETGKTLHEYRKGGLRTGETLPSTPRQLIVIENGQRSVFEPDRDPKTNTYKRAPGQPLYYRDGKGRALVEITFDRVGTYRVWPLFLGVFVNVAFLAVWFACLWLLLRFQWAHALGLALVLWGVSLFVMSTVLHKAETVARPPPVVATGG